MDLTILSNISQILQTAIAVLGGIFLLMLAPGLTIEWMKKLIYLSVAIALWMVFVYQYGNDLKTLIICVLSVIVYRIFTESTIIFMYQCFLFLVTAKMLFWFLDVRSHNHPAAHKPTK